MDTVSRRTMYTVSRTARYLYSRRTSRWYTTLSRVRSMITLSAIHNVSDTWLYRHGTCHAPTPPQAHTSKHRIRPKLRIRPTAIIKTGYSFSWQKQHRIRPKLRIRPTAIIKTGYSFSWQKHIISLMPQNYYGIPHPGMLFPGFGIFNSQISVTYWPQASPESLHGI